MAKEIKLDSNGKRKFGMRDKIAYAAGDFGCNMSFALKGTVQTFWLVYMMMETGLLSLLLLLVQVWDAINDPLIGSLIDNDRRKYKMGKFKTYIFIGACGLLVGGAAVFLPFPKAPLVIKAVLFILGYIIWDAFYTIANVPYGSMLSLITTDNAERAQLSTWRSIGSMFGNMLPSMLLPMLIWRKVNFDGTTDFLDKIAIPEGFEKSQFLTHPIEGTPYQIGDPVLSPETGKQVEILLGDRVFWTALIMGIIGFAAFILMIKLITVRVDENTVPAFIWHTANDEVVDVNNSLVLAKALIKEKIPTELHVYPFGWHGLSVCVDGIEFESNDKNHIHVSNWVRDCAQWTKLV